MIYIWISEYSWKTRVCFEWVFRALSTFFFFFFFLSFFLMFMQIWVLGFCNLVLTKSYIRLKIKQTIKVAEARTWWSMPFSSFSSWSVCWIIITKKCCHKFQILPCVCRLVCSLKHLLNNLCLSIKIICIGINIEYFNMFFHTHMTIHTVF